MTADLTEFDAAIRTGGQRLRVDVVLRELTDDQAEALRAALNLPDRYTAPAVARTVTGWGVNLSESAVRSWRDKNV